MTEYLLRGPADEPVTVREMLDFCKAEATHARTLMALRVSARLEVEARTGLALMEQLWRLTAHEWPNGGIFETKTSPVIRVESARAHDVDGQSHEIEPYWFRKLPPSKLYTTPNPPVGIHLRERNGIEIDFIAGFGANRTDVPVKLRQAILVHVGYRFEQTDAPHTPDAQNTPDIFFDMLHNFRRK